MSYDDVFATDVVWFCHNPSRFAVDSLKSSRRNLEKIGLSVSKMQSETVRKIYEQQISRVIFSIDDALAKLERNDKFRKPQYDTRDAAAPTVIGLTPEQVTDEQICAAIDTIQSAIDYFCKGSAPRELFLGPFFKKYLNMEFEEMDNTSRKAVITRMEDMRLVRIEQRPTDEGDGEFAVLVPDFDAIAQYENELDDKSIPTTEL